ncbi:4-alpha-glucanotransferase [Sulfuricystis multivorans]|uniref:4-alpha-glucanotransferase n=1 Tax=Sulfuricystis multivorans TaxID=2211108 RepID=UPI000F83D6DB|nr:4-alpha-glucanotransferase [Sulfuricystis multivorans]
MNETALERLAEACGIAREYHDIWGGHHPTSASTQRDLLAAMHFDLTRDAEELLAEFAAAQRTLPALPDEAMAQCCHLPAVLAEGGRLWGLSVQLYSLRSGRNWGIGDFTDLAALVELVAAAGGDFIGLNPLHALFPDDPTRISPYSPSHRAFLNVLYIDVEAVPEFAACEAVQSRIASAEFQAQLTALRAQPLVDYPGVARLKLEILRALFDFWRAHAGACLAGFAVWREAQGEALEHFARFETLQAHFRAQDPDCWGWPAWPEEYRDPASPAVAAFAENHAVEIDWHAWLQWLADSQLAAVAARARERGMAIGLYRDLAVGAHPGGAEVWQWQDVFAIGNGGAHTGAPPDDLNLLGQDWGLPPLIPHRLREASYAPFIEVLHANMRHAGALRIDHVMGLSRLFWVPADTPATEGAYVHYPFATLLGLVARASLDHACLVIGEDLGTVPEGFRERLFAAGVLSYHPLIFERYPDGNFRLPVDMPRQALVSASTHDLPTLAGFWQGVDLEIRTRLMLFPSSAVRERLITERGWDRGRLLWALERENLLPTGVSKDPAALPDLTPEVIAAIHAYLARSPAMLLSIQPEDVFACRDQINVPGTLEDQHPNWQRKLPQPLEEWPMLPGWYAVIDAVRAER